MNISSLTPVITALRQETAQNAISPERLGALLQSIADLLEQAGLLSTQNTITSWKSSVSNVSPVTHITQGSSDRNNINLTVKRTGLNNFQEVVSVDDVLIKQATTDRAGAMRAQQVIDLNTAKSNISGLQTTVNSIQTQLNNGTRVALASNTTVGGMKLSPTGIFVLDNNGFLVTNRELNTTSADTTQGDLGLTIKDGHDNSADCLYICIPKASLTKGGIMTKEDKKKLDRFTTVPVITNAEPCAEANHTPDYYGFTQDVLDGIFDGTFNQVKLGDTIYNITYRGTYGEGFYLEVQQMSKIGETYTIFYFEYNSTRGMSIQMEEQ